MFQTLFQSPLGSDVNKFRVNYCLKQWRLKIWKTQKIENNAWMNIAEENQNGQTAIGILKADHAAKQFFKA